MKPRNPEEIAAAILQAEQDHKPLKAIGSSFSASAAAKSDGYVVDTSDLKNIVAIGLPRLATAYPKARRNNLVLVEAGIKLHQLAEQLWAKNRSLPTLGGSIGQSLAGVIMTSTHGADLKHSSVAGMVRAIHLVGTNGQQYWLEDPKRPVTSNYSLSRYLPRYSRNLRIIRETEAFQSALVSVGRCGIVYSYIIEVEDHFKLDERRIKSSWRAVRDHLKTAAHSGDWLQYMQKAFGQPPKMTGVNAQLRSFDIALNPEDNGPAWINGRWKTPTDASGKLPGDYNMGNGPDYERDGKTLEAVQALDHLGLADFLSLAKIGYHIQLGDKPVEKRGRNYHITSSFPQPTYKNYQDMYNHFWKSKKARFLEVFFNAEEDNYLAYVERLFELYRRGNAGTQAGYIAIRFTSRSEAPLAMQQWKHTVAIEIVMLEGFSGTEVGLVFAIQEAANLGAIFHWGMLLNKQPKKIDLETWRRGAQRLGIRKGDVFSSSFTREHGLEP